MGEVGNGHYMKIHEGSAAGDLGTMAGGVDASRTYESDEDITLVELKSMNAVEASKIDFKARKVTLNKHFYPDPDQRIIVTVYEAKIGVRVLAITAQAFYENYWVSFFSDEPPKYNKIPVLREDKELKNVENSRVVRKQAEGDPDVLWVRM